MSQVPRGPVDDVIVEPGEALRARPRAREGDAFMRLSETLAHKPDNAVKLLCELAMKLTKSGSAGVSLEDAEGGEEVLRWVAVTGEFSRYHLGTMPRHFSPCGTVLERRRTLVMREPARHFEYIAGLHAPVSSALLVPFARRGRLVGTLWVLSHDEARTYTTADVAVVEELTTFATALLDTLKPPAKIRGT